MSPSHRVVKKIGVGSIMQETCSFTTLKTTLQDFKDSYFKQGAAVVNVAKNDWVAGGFIDGIKHRHFQLEGLVALHETAGGPITAETFAELQELMLSSIKQAGKLDALFITLHGAMAADNEPDPDGVIIEEIRKLVGPDCFIGLVLDHHANVTKKKVAAPDVIVAFDTQPHDLPATGAKAARVLLDIWEKNRTPHRALIKIPMLTPQDHFLTASGPMKAWFDLAREIEKDPAVIVASTYPTQPWLDVPESGWSVLVYADDAATAQRYAKILAQKAWDLRDQFWVSARTPIPETIAQAKAAPRGLVVISDTGDSSFGGSPGDSMVLIAEMLKQGLTGTALVPVVDPGALHEAIHAGVGREITLQIGGKMSAEFSPSLKIKGVVKAVVAACELDFGDGLKSKAGGSVLFDCGHLKIALREIRDRAINHPILYEMLGLDVAQAQMVVLKTASNFQYFRKFQSRLIRADTPGATQSDLTAFRWRHIDHPTYPFDPLPDWKP